MLSIEKALDIYTDKINSGETIDLSYFQKELSEIDYAEFTELIPFVGLAKSIKVTDDFDVMFNSLNKKKKELYDDSLPQAAGFRAGKDAVSDKAKKRLDEIFKEEFEDDKK